MKRVRHTKVLTDVEVDLGSRERYHRGVSLSRCKTCRVCLKRSQMFAGFLKVLLSDKYIVVYYFVAVAVAMSRLT